MEQQPQPVMAPPARLHVYISPALISLAIVMVVAGGVWWWGKRLLPQGAAPSTVEVPTVSGGITFLASSTPLITKDVKVDYYNPTDVLYVVKIGTVNEGMYKGKNLALGYLYYMFKVLDASDEMINPYVYFIADDKGTPLAWDSRFTHDRGYVSNALGLEKIPETKLDIIPSELGSGDIHSKGQRVYTSRVSLFPRVKTFDSLPPADFSENGWPIIKRANEFNQPIDIIPRPSPTTMLFPFGLTMDVYAQPNFINADDVPALTWTKGTTTIMSYRYGQYAYGWQDCYEGISPQKFQANLVQTGITAKGDPVYELNEELYPQVYACLHEKTRRYTYDPVTQNGEYEDTIEYKDFILTHPMFFWKDSFGDTTAFIRSDVVPAAEKAKPVIYLYPEKTEKVSVRVAPVGGFTKTEPVYGNGWVVKAGPNGVITNSDGKKYSYLFWEGGKEGVVTTPKQGFVVARADIKTVLQEKLAAFGLNTQERADFIEFWAPKLQQAPYYFITFISRAEIDRVAPLTVQPQPDTVIRVLMDYKPLTQPVAVEPLQIAPTERRGFTVVEWGGIVR
jgi:hypothetical protein